MTHPLPFDRINEFILISLIQEGPYSLAVLGYQENLNRPVFLKLLKPVAQNEQKWIERFKREALVCAKLKNPHIIDIYTFGNFEDYFFIAMEYIQGVSLKDLLNEEKKLKLEDAIFILTKVLEALDEVHSKNIIHRDIKPGNILLDIHGEVRLTDFGLAYLGEDLSMTHQDTILGTPAYMSPEQITGETILPQSDYFSLGSTFYEMVSGQKTFSGDSYSACIQKILHDNPPAPTLFEPDLPQQIVDIVFWLLAKEASDRPVDIAQITQKLNTFTSKMDISQVKKHLGQLVQKYYQPQKDIQKSLTKQLSPEETDAGTQKQIIRSWSGYLMVGIIILGIISLTIFFLFKNGEGPSPLSSSVLLDSIHKTVPDKFQDDSLNTRADSNTVSIENMTGAKSEKDSKIAGEALRNRQNLESLKYNMKSIDTLNEISSENIAETEMTEKALQSTLILNIEPWGMILLNGVLLDSLTHYKSMTIVPGTYQLIISHPEFPPKVVDIELFPGQSRSITYSFIEQSGFLMIEVRPWAEVYIDGKYIDSTPLARPIALPEGEHIIELRHPSFQKVREEISISLGDTLLLKKVL